MARFLFLRAAHRLFVTLAFASLLDALFSANALYAQVCGCSNCPQEITDDQTVDLLLQVSGATNPTLGQNGQAICGVLLNFSHDYLGDLSIKLTNPAGNSVTLVGPEGFWEPTNLTTWSVTFLPCSDAPDPDGSFESKWNSDQMWGTLGNYNGSYHPFMGCLELLNSGPVNGTWKLTVADAQENDLGIFFDYQIIFCDPAGINCLTCEADAGNLLQPDIAACQGADTLKLQLPPTYPVDQVPPPSPQYAYRYVLSGPGGTILSYIAQPDLRQLIPGNYTLCGLSFPAAQTALLPPPNGTLTVQQLAASLNSAIPPFCGDLTANCVNVNILPVPPNTVDTVVVCFPDCYILGNDTLCQPGTYVDTLTQNGCTYTATVLLRIQMPDTVQVYETICEGQCSATPGFGQNCASGVFTQTFKSAAGCDSTVVLTLNQLFAEAQIAKPDTLLCNRPTVPLLGTGSSTGADISYRWTAKNGGQIIGPTDGLDAVAGKAGIYQLKVCHTDTVNGEQCCDSVSVTVIKRNVPPPTPGPISGLSILCPGQTATYSIASVPGASTYNWLVPPGVSIQSGQGDTSIVLLWNSPTASAICVTAADSCGNLSMPRCRTVQTGQVAPPVQTPQGAAAACRETPEVYEIPPFTGASNYEWTVNAPHAIASGQGTPSVSIAWGNAPTAQVCVKVTNNCGTSPAGCLNVAVSALPGVPMLSGDTTVCRLDTFTYTLSPLSGATGYNWTLSSGQILSGQNTPQVQVLWDGSAGTHSLCAEVLNDCGTGPQTCLNIRSGTPPTLGQVTRSCDAADLNYFVSFPVMGGTAPFSIAGGAVAGGVFTSNPIPNSVPYQFVLTDANGCKSVKIKGNYDCNCISKAGQLGTQMLAVCEGGMATAVLTGAVTDPNDLSIFLLHSDSSAVFGTIFAQNSSGVFSLQAGMNYGTRYYISHVVGNPLNGLPDPDDPCYGISNIQPVVFFKNPVTNAGLDQSSCGKILSLGASGTGQWSVTQRPPNANLLLSNAQSPTATAQADSTGLYQLTWTVLDANGCIGQDVVALRFHPQPALAQLSRTCDAANLNYVVLLTLAKGTPPYTVNGTPLPGSTFTSASFANGQTFSFTVSDANGCTMQPVIGAYDCSCTSGAGTMSSQLLERCEGALAQSEANPDLKPDPDDVTGFVLHDGSGPSLGKVLAQNNSGAFGFLPGMEYGKVYYISRTVGNSQNGLPNPLDPCFSVSVGQPVVFYQKPVPYAGKDTAVCGQKTVLQAVKGNYPGVWTLVSGPGTAVFSAPNDPKSEVQVSVPGTYILGWTEQNATCTATDAVSLTFRAQPDFFNLVEVCNATNSGFVVQFEMTSGDAPFTTSGLAGTFTGTSFISVELASNAPYLFAVVDANGCRSAETFGSHNCVCVTDAGTMQVVPPTDYCAGEPVSAMWNNNAILDADDLVEFILHDQPGSTVGNILARSNQPVFPFQPTYQTSTVYYISAIAGSGSGGSIILADKCLSVTPGVPVFWKDLPSVDISGTDTICLGDPALLSFSGSGAFPLTLTYTDGSLLFDLPITGPQLITLMPSPGATTTYQLLSVKDGSVLGCTVPLMDAATVTVNQPVRAGTANGTLDLCEGSVFPFQLVNLLTDADSGGLWTDVSAKPALPGSLDPVVGTFQVLGQSVGTYRFRYSTTSPAPCPDDSEEVELRINRPPDADAGENKALNCDQLSVLLEGKSTSPNALFAWLKNGDTTGVGQQVFVQDSGRYVLVVTNAAGCTATDSVQVDLATQPPKAKFSTTGLRCFGDGTGSISVDSILVGEPPVLFALNGGAFGSKRDFKSLAAGQYTVSLQDANGCEWTSDPISVTQPPPVTAALGPDVSIHLGDTALLAADLSHPISALKSIVWRPLLDTASVGGATQRFVPTHSVQVAVEVTDTMGCKGRDVVWVLVNLDRHIFIPNIIAPQSSENGTALIYGGDDVATVEVFQIFDRWGSELFHRENFPPNDPEQGWDGKAGGEDVQPGVYVWRVQVRFVDGRSEVFWGDLTVMR